MKYVNVILGIIFFIYFAYSLEYFRGFYTWILLLISVLNILIWAVEEIKDEIKKLKNER